MTSFRPALFCFFGFFAFSVSGLADEHNVVKDTGTHGLPSSNLTDVVPSSSANLPDQPIHNAPIDTQKIVPVTKPDKKPSSRSKPKPDPGSATVSRPVDIQDSGNGTAVTSPQTPQNRLDHQVNDLAIGEQGDDAFNDAQLAKQLKDLEEATSVLEIDELLLDSVVNTDDRRGEQNQQVGNLPTQDDPMDLGVVDPWGYGASNSPSYLGGDGSSGKFEPYGFNVAVDPRDAASGAASLGGTVGATAGASNSFTSLSNPEEGLGPQDDNYASQISHPPANGSDNTVTEVPGSRTHLENDDGSSTNSWLLTNGATVHVRTGWTRNGLLSTQTVTHPNGSIELHTVLINQQGRAENLSTNNTVTGTAQSSTTGSSGVVGTLRVLLGSGSQDLETSTAGYDLCNPLGGGCYKPTRINPVKDNPGDPDNVQHSGPSLVADTDSLLTNPDPESTGVTGTPEHKAPESIVTDSSGGIPDPRGGEGETGGN